MTIATDTAATPQRLIDAALECMSEGGYQSASARAITRAAGVNPGLLQYYYEGKGPLMLEAYRQFTQGELAAALHAAVEAWPDPAGQLAAFTREALFFGAQGDRRLNTWVAFQELVITDAGVAAAQAEYHDCYLEALGGWIADIAAAKGERLTAAAVRRLAIGAGAVIDGVRLERARNPSRMTPEEALSIALGLIEPPAADAKTPAP